MQLPSEVTTGNTIVALSFLHVRNSSHASERNCSTNRALERGISDSLPRSRGIEPNPPTRIVIVALHLRSDIKNNISSRLYGLYKPVPWSNNEELIFKNIPVVKSSWGGGYAVTNALRKRSAFLVWLFGRKVGDMKVGAVSLVIPDIRPDTRRIDQKPEYFAIRKCLSKLDAQVVDLEGPLSEALTSDSTSPVIFEHDLHWTPHGHGIVGRTVAWAPVHL